MKCKKLIATLLVAVTAMTSVIGCGKKEEADDGEVKLTIWYYNDALSTKVLEDAKKQFPDYNLDIKKMPSDGYETKVDTALNSGNGPDIATMFSMAPYYKYSDKFVNLLEYGADDVKDEYLDWKWDICLTPDKSAMIGFPMDIGPMALFYRADLFEAAGLPSEPDKVSSQLNTWEAYLDAAEQLKDKTGVKMFDSITSVFKGAYLQMEEFSYDREGNLIVENGHVREAWDIAIDALERDVVSLSSGNEWGPAANEGVFASFPGASWQQTNIEQSAPDTTGKWRIASIPGGSGNYGGSFLSVFKSTKYPKEAAEVAMWLMNSDNQLAAYSDINVYPSTPSIYDDAAMNKENEFFGGQVTNEYFSISAENINTSYIDPRESQTMDAFMTALSLVEGQGKDPEKAWEDALAEAKLCAEQK